MFTQNFFTDNATHKQNCTSFNPKRVITHNVYDRKPFLNMSRSVAQITHTKVAGCAIMRVKEGANKQVISSQADSLIKI
ncbi:hypothetical protein, partial [Pluralibacter gergoviae]